MLFYYLAADSVYTRQGLLFPHPRGTESNIRFSHYSHCDCHQWPLPRHSNRVSFSQCFVMPIIKLLLSLLCSQVVRRIEVSPVGRMENLSNLLRGSAGANELSIPCGNFSRQYACMCDYYGLPYREEVAWVLFINRFLIFAFSYHFSSFFSF